MPFFVFFNTKNRAKIWADRVAGRHACNISAWLFLPLVLFMSAAGDVLAQSGQDNALQEDKVAVVYALEIGSNGEDEFLRLHLDGAPPHRAFLMQNPNRLVIEFDRTRFGIEKETPKRDVPANGSVFKDVRYGLISREKSRLVAVLNEPVQITRQEFVGDEANADGSRKLFELEVAKTSQEAFDATVTRQIRLLGSSGEAVIKGDRVRAGPKKKGRFTIILDPGHGGIDGGSSGTAKNIIEKNITLAVAQLIEQKLPGLGPYDVYMTRYADEFVSLRNRQKFARRYDGDLLISLHADSLKEDYVRGATIYTLAKKATDSLAHQIAQSENLADLVAGLAAPDAKDDVTDILADLTLRETTRFSREMAELLVNRLKTSVQMIKNPHRAASFMVLRNAEIPGILLELGYLSNKEDEKLLSQPQWQVMVADMVARTIHQYFVRRSANSSAN